ncbi:beta-alanine-activating enzyme-like isoform X2 [Ornithodoros turicata]|uniref:beta-alanine-activating enzyme-like isoform X2 n=1 Tax=Ornithodoros turicata TaxID=34597 RepID=UPI003139CAA9
MTKLLLQSDFDSLCGKLKDKVAVVYDVGKHRSSLTYGNLDDISRKIAHKIQSHGCSNSVVACLCRPTAFAPALIIGTLRAKCAFMFLDIEDAEYQFTHPVNILAGDKQLFETVLDQSHWQVIDCLWDNTSVLAKYIKERDPTMLANSSTGVDIAYVMKTSGTTGRPKVVRVPHECILPNINHLRELLNVSSKDVIFQAAPLTFDPCIVEMFLALGSGATLFMTLDSVKMNPRLISSLLVSNAVSVMQVTPSFFLRLSRPLVTSALLARNSNLRVLVFGGEACPTSQLLHEWKENGNETEFYNVYGITEVSCWATCSRIDVESRSTEPVPLGRPLEGTVLEVRSENGDAINEGLGTLFVGGTQRRCLIDLETPEQLDACHMRNTGDIVCQSPGGTLTYVGRRDRMIKYNGKKINPSYLEEVLKRTLMLQDCYCHFVSNRAQLLVFVLLPHEEDRGKMKKIDDVLKQECRCPYSVHLVSVFPMSRHGKVNYRALVRLAEKMQENSGSSTSVDPKVLLEKLWKETTDREVAPESNFILSGGNSINAVNISQEVELAAGCSLPLLLETILNETFSDVLAYIESTTCRDSPPFRTENSRKRKQEAALEAHCNHLVKTSPCFSYVSRFDEWVQCGCEKSCHSNIREEDTSIARAGLSINWRYDLLKCVDASPLLVDYKGGDTVMFIGSHYGKFSAVHTRGVSFWDTYLPNRIESSACISVSGKYVAVGCHDYHIYSLRSDSGHLHWKYQTGGEVKSSTALNKTNNALLCGSHDKHIYCIDFETGNLQWKKQISEGSVFASPTVSYKPYCVYAATLDGRISSLCPDTGNTLWCHTLSKPIFSSPLVLTRGVCVCCVGGTASLLDHTSGCLLWTTQLGGPIFSSPVLHQEPVPFIIFGCHDKHLYVIKESDGSVVHSLSFDSPIYCTAFCVEKSGESAVVVTASTEGTVYVVDCREGTKLASYHLPGCLPTWKTGECRRLLTQLEKSGDCQGIWRKLAEVRENQIADKCRDNMQRIGRADQWLSGTTVAMLLLVAVRQCATSSEAEKYRAALIILNK